MSNTFDRLLSDGYWYHTFEINGITTPGVYDFRKVIKSINFPSMQGKTVLDVGCSDGFFSSYFEAMGAHKVVGLDINKYDGSKAIDNLERYDEIYKKKYARIYDYDFLKEDYESLGLQDNNKFNVVKSLLNLKMVYLEGSVYDLSGCGRFDIVFCGSLIEHLRDPITAIEQLKSVANDYVIIDLSSCMHQVFDVPRVNFMRYSGGGGSFYNFSAYAFKRLLENMGFAEVVVKNRYKILDKNTRRITRHAVFVCKV